MEFQNVDYNHFSGMFCKRGDVLQLEGCFVIGGMFYGVNYVHPFFKRCATPGPPAALFKTCPSLKPHSLVNEGEEIWEDPGTS